MRRRRITAMLVFCVLGVLLLEIVVGPAGERARHGASAESFSIESDAVGRELEARAIVPAGAGEGPARPLLVFLHGRGGSPSDNLNEEMYDALDAEGDRAPIVVFPDGGDHSYWHDRADGAWGSYVAEEVIPAAVERLGADPRRVAIGGISMGGYGAFEIARQNPSRFCAVGGHSPAIFAAGADSAPGSFDGAADFSRHDVFNAVTADPEPWGGLPVFLDSGTEDSLHTITVRFARQLEAASADVSLHAEWSGGHSGAYWRSHYDDYLRFYAQALARCGR